VERPQILFLTQYLRPTKGMEVVTIRLAGELAPHADVDVVAAMGETVEIPGVDVATLGQTCARLKYPRLLTRLVPLAWGTRRRREGLVVVTVGVWVSVLWLLLTPVHRSRTVVWDHSLSLEKRATSRSLRGMAALARILYRRARVVVAVSDPLAADLGSLTSAPIRIIPNPIDLDAPADVVRADDQPVGARTFVCVGALTATKNQAEAIRAVAASGSNASLLVLGDGEQRASLEELAHDLGVAGRVTFAGHVPHEAAVEAISRADFLLHTAHGETFGMVYFEAASAGTPVIARSLRLEESIIPDAVPGYLYSSFDDLVALVQDSAVPDQEQLRRARTFRLDHYSTPAIVRLWLDLIGGVRR